MRTRAIVTLLAAALAASPVRAAVSHVGSEFQVNDHTTGLQIVPDVAVAPGGSFVVVWASDSQDGSGYGIFARRFGDGGSPLGAEFQVNTYTTSYQYAPAVAMDGAGGFVVVWTSGGQDGSIHGIFGQLFDSTGDPVGDEFQVNTYTTEAQATCDVAASPTGDFVVVWGSGGQDGSVTGVFAQRYDSTGAPIGDEFQVNTYTTNGQSEPAIAMNGTGGFVVVWTSDTQDGSLDGTFGRLFDSSGDPVGDEFQVNTYTTGSQLHPGVAAHEDGEFLVVWQSPNPAREMTARRFDSGGQPLGGEFQVATSAPYLQGAGAVVANGGVGGFVVAWDEVPAPASSADVFGRLIDAGGAPAGADFVVNSYVGLSQINPAAGIDAAGSLVIVWQSVNQDGSSYGIFGQRYHGSAPGLTSHVDGDALDCSNPALTRPTFTWDSGSYDRFRVYVGPDPGFGKGSYVTSGDTLLSGTSWSPSKKKWRNACRKALEADPVTPEMFVRALGKDRDLGKKDPARLLFSDTVACDVLP